MAASMATMRRCLARMAAGSCRVARRQPPAAPTAPAPREALRISGAYLRAMPVGAAAAAVAASLAAQAPETLFQPPAACFSETARELSPSFPCGGGFSAQYDMHGSNGFMGSGNYGSVCTATERASGKMVAVKTVPKSRTSEAAVLDETSIMMAAAHANTVKLRGFYRDRSSYYLVMDLATGGELYERLVSKGMLTEQQASSVLRQLLEALVHMHSLGICHADVKPENILIESESPVTGNLRIKLADFGSAFRVHDGPPSRKDYTAAYSAPEVVAGRADASPAGDVWAVGVVAYILLTGRHPFDPQGTASESEVLRRVVHDEPDFSPALWEGVDPVARDLVKAALNKSPSQRPSAAIMLSHPWLQGVRAAQ